MLIFSGGDETAIVFGVKFKISVVPPNDMQNYIALKSLHLNLFKICFHSEKVDSQFRKFCIIDTYLIRDYNAIKARSRKNLKSLFRM